MNNGKGKLLVASIGTVVGLYGLLFLILILIFEFLAIDLEYLLITSVIILAIDFLISPFFMDITLNWFYKIQWREKNEIPEYVADFIQAICTEKNIKFPKFGIIDDNAPNAFTYGRTPNSARVVITKGCINMLSKDELKAVIAHEMGHVVHWDMLLMTVVQLVPVIAYSIARNLAKVIKRRSNNNNNKSDAIVLGIVALSYVIYFVSEYIILWFSRVREYYADNYAGEVTGNPNYLTSALIKIGFGLKTEEEKNNSKVDSVSALGISDNKACKTLGITVDRDEGVFDRTKLNNIAKWDLQNPWATFYELNSTHPLITKRLKKLSEQAIQNNIEPIYVFENDRKGSYVPHFIKELLICITPTLIFIIGMIISIIVGIAGDVVLPAILISLLITFFASLLKTVYRYPNKIYNRKQVSDLLQEVKVSGVTSVPCTISGKLIGKGTPGYMFSEDFILEDETGIMYLDYKQPLSLWNSLFGLLRAGKYIDKDVEIKGWYRRAPLPYIEIKEMNVEGKIVKCHSYMTQVVFTIIMIVLAIVGIAFSIL